MDAISVLILLISHRFINFHGFVQTVVNSDDSSRFGSEMFTSVARMLLEIKAKTGKNFAVISPLKSPFAELRHKVSRLK